MSTVKTLTLKASAIPEKLRNIPDPPNTLYYRGTELGDLLQKPIVAIVGSRKVDAYGTHVTKLLASDLAKAGVVIISGLALGVDAIAHKACLDTGTPTLAVLPCGIESIYPKTNYQLGQQIIKNGGLISEYEGSHSPREHEFLIRNRLVSGLADLVIITEAAARSGSLNTAQHALNQGKTVMAIPGPITNPLCEGTNALLKMGAMPVTTAEDVLRVLGMELESRAERDYQLLAQNESELKIINLLLGGVIEAEELAIKSGLVTKDFNIHLTMLEIRGIIKPLGANRWTLN